MTEQQEVQPSAAASVADNKQPGQKVNNKKSSSGAVGGIAILLALGLTGGLYLHGHKNAVAQQGELNQLKLQLAEAMNKLDQSNSKDGEQLAALGKQQQLLQDELKGCRPGCWISTTSAPTTGCWPNPNTWCGWPVASCGWNTTSSPPSHCSAMPTSASKALNDPSLCPSARRWPKTSPSSRGCHASTAKG